MTAIRSEIRRVTREGTPPFQCMVTVESVTELSPGFRRIAISGEGLSVYGDVLPADAFKKPGGRIQAWLAAEASVVRGLRRFATADLGVTHDDLHAAAYWKAGVNSTDMDTVYLERYGREIASGADAADPDVREKVELEV